MLWRGNKKPVEVKKGQRAGNVSAGGEGGGWGGEHGNALSTHTSHTHTQHVKPRWVSGMTHWLCCILDSSKEETLGGDGGSVANEPVLRTGSWLAESWGFLVFEFCFVFFRSRTEKQVNDPHPIAVGVGGDLEPVLVKILWYTYMSHISHTSSALLQGESLKHWLCFLLSNYIWKSAHSLCGQGTISNLAYLHRRGGHFVQNVGKRSIKIYSNESCTAPSLPAPRRSFHQCVDRMRFLLSCLNFSVFCHWFMLFIYHTLLIW